MRQITVKEFFSLRSLMNGLSDDFEIGYNNYINLNYKDQDILNILFTKSLHWENRRRFLKTIDKNFQPLELTYKSIRDLIKFKGNDMIYKKILLKIMTT
jgi:hypothetical protein